MAWTAPQVWGALWLLATISSGPAMSACPQKGLFWDDCNLCWCRDDFVACSNVNCAGQPPTALLEREGGSGRAASDDEWRPPPPAPPPDRQGVIAFRPGRGRMRARGRQVADGWACEFASSWLESEGCVQCSCLWGGKIHCVDSGLCKDSKPEPTSVENVGDRWRRSAAEETPISSTLGPVTLTPSSVLVTQTTQLAEGSPTASPGPGSGSESTPGTRGPAGLGITAQATVVKERSCKSGSTWEEECNACWCLDNNMAACTAHRCGDPAAVPLPLAAPGGASRAPNAPTSTGAPIIHEATGSPKPAEALSTTDAPTTARVEGTTGAPRSTSALSTQSAAASQDASHPTCASPAPSAASDPAGAPAASETPRPPAVSTTASPSGARRRRRTLVRS